MMKIFIFVAAFMLIFISTAVFFVQNADASQSMFWTNWFESINLLLIPFVFALVIVGFSALAFQRINE